MSSQQSWREPTSFFFQKGEEKRWVREDLEVAKESDTFKAVANFTPIVAAEL